MTKNLPNVTLYTDGACLGNPGPGGWGALLIFNETEKKLSGGTQQTTNNQMEMMAAIKALRALTRPCQVDLYTDSIYLRDGMTKWLDGWKKKGWKNAQKKPVKNRDLWEELDQLAKKHDIHWHWVKGHDGNPGNERADQLASDAAKQIALEIADQMNEQK